MRYPASILDEIRNRLPLSQVVGQRVQWDRRKTQAAKGDFWACCPFHGEKTPSFHADDRRGRYHCFGCGKDGDIFTFLTETDGVSFPEAVQRLADDAGIPLPAPDAQSEAREKRQASLADVMEEASLFFESELQSTRGAKVRSYLEGRRMGGETQKRFRIGYAGSSRNALKQHLAGKGISQEMMAEAGLIVTGDDIPVSFDRFRDRVIFPIADFRGRIVGFGGRALSADAQAKYLNSPETPLFQKGSLLYHGREARAASRAAGTIVVVEGYVDVIAMAVAGFEHTVAPLGTALTERQLHLLWRMAPEPILCFDGDQAGIRAAHRVMDMALPLLEPDRSIRFALLPDGVDPDDLIGSAGPEAMRQLLDTATPLVEMLWERETISGQFDTPERRAGLEKRVQDLAKSVGHESVRRHYREALEQRLRAFLKGDAPSASPASARRPPYQKRRGFDDWRSAQNRGPTTPRYRAAEPTPFSAGLLRSVRQAGGTTPNLAEATLLVTVIHHESILHQHLDDFLTLELDNRELDALRRAIVSAVASDEALGSLSKALTDAGHAPLLQRLDTLVRSSGAWQALEGADDTDAEEAWMQALTLHRRSRALHKELEQAEAAYAGDMSEPNFARMVEIQRQLSNVDGVEASIDGFGQASGRRAQDI